MRCLNIFKQSKKVKSIWQCTKCTFRGEADKEEVLNSLCTCPKCGEGLIEKEEYVIVDEPGFRESDREFKSQGEDEDIDDLKQELIEWASDEFVVVDRETGAHTYQVDSERLYEKGKELGLSEDTIDEVFALLVEGSSRVGEDEGISGEVIDRIKRLILENPQWSEWQIEEQIYEEFSPLLFVDEKAKRELVLTIKEMKEGNFSAESTRKKEVTFPENPYLSRDQAAEQRSFEEAPSDGYGMQEDRVPNYYARRGCLNILKESFNDYIIFDKSFMAEGFHFVKGMVARIFETLEDKFQVAYKGKVFFVPKEYAHVACKENTFIKVAMTLLPGKSKAIKELPRWRLEEDEKVQSIAKSELPYDDKVELIANRAGELVLSLCDDYARVKEPCWEKPVVDKDEIRKLIEDYAQGKIRGKDVKEEGPRPNDVTYRFAKKALRIDYEHLDIPPSQPDLPEDEKIKKKKKKLEELYKSRTGKPKGTYEWMQQDVSEGPAMFSVEHEPYTSLTMGENKVIDILNKHRKLKDEYIEMEEVICPFCKQEDFDLVGLKSHLLHGDCEIFEKTENIERLF